MSDSDSKDSDDGIRYKTESVRNKANVTEFTHKSNRDHRHKNVDRKRYKRRYLKSPLKKNNKRRKKNRNLSGSSSSSSSTSSSDSQRKDKFTNQESKQRDKTNDQRQINQNEIIGPALPPHLQVKKNQISISGIPKSNSNIEPGNTLKKDFPLHFVVGSKLPTHMTNTAKSDSCIGSSLPSAIKTNSKLEQDDDITQQSQTSTSLSRSEEKKADQIIGPSLPPHLQKNVQEDIKDYCLESNIRAGKDSQTLLSLTTVTQSKENDADKVIGPSLPSHLRKNVQQEMGNSITQTEEDSQSISPLAIQPQENHTEKVIGPSLPPHLRKHLQKEIRDHSVESNKQTDEDSQSLSLLTTLTQSEEKDTGKVIGPSLPPHLRKKLEEESSSPFNMETEAEDVYGPLPPGMSDYSLSHKALEERALQLKIDQLEPQGNNEPVRESWMIELPAAKAANFGLGPRQFRNRPAPDLSDRSSWTDLPGDKKKKRSEEVPVDLKAEAALKELRKRDEEQESLTKKHKRKEKSLLKMHKEQLEKEKKDEKSTERRPFSRDIDLQANRFDDAQKQAILKKAQLLDTRFSSGKSKFL